MWNTALRLIVLLAVLPASTSSLAFCSNPGLGRWHFGEARRLNWHTTGGDTCAVELSPHRQTQMADLRISARARHGLAARSGLTGMAYKPNEGFKGVDTFSFSFSGAGPETRGVTTVQVTVRVD
jgi:hypothetical protein